MVWNCRVRKKVGVQVLFMYSTVEYIPFQPRDVEIHFPMANDLQLFLLYVKTLDLKANVTFSRMFIDIRVKYT